ncbi:MAG: 50S ribosomal protein L11 methyltransferase [Chitinophagaceae bacterium]
MDSFYKITFSAVLQEQKDILIARLTEIGFEGFEEGHSFLIAYCTQSNFKEEIIHELCQALLVQFEKELIKNTNWNEQWEKNFHPVIVDNFCVIRAHFHSPIPEIIYDIIITPKMSFGTGHHATTYMMIQWMKEIQFAKKSILDFGTGTGILAILAEKLGADKIDAIDNDDWSIDNAKENILFNNCRLVDLQKAEKIGKKEKYDIILANINKNVLLLTMGDLKQQLAGGGVIIISGILAGDRSAIEEKAVFCGLKLVGIIEKDGWIALQITLN